MLEDIQLARATGEKIPMHAAAADEIARRRASPELAIRLNGAREPFRFTNRIFLTLR